MKKKNLFAFVLLFCTFAFAFMSCKNDENETADSAMLTATASNETQASTINDQLLSEVDTYVGTSMQSAAPFASVKATGLPTVTIENTGIADGQIKYIINFGTEGFKGKHNNVMKGKLIVVIAIKNKLVDISNPLFWVGASRTITYDNFTFNGLKVSGTNTISFSGWTNAQHPYWEITGDNILTLLDGRLISWKSERRIEFTDVALLWGTNYIVTGKATGVNANGKSYSMIIKDTNPLTGSTTYPYVTKGTVTVTVGSSTGILDYGDGLQDNKATMTYNGIIFPFEIK